MGKLLAKIPDDNPRNESEAERNDRNYQELLQEMRVMQAGVQILFGFLLSLAFQSRFSEVTDFQRHLYLATLIGAMLSTGFLIASVPFHRLVFRRGMKEDLIRATQRFVGAGLTFLFLTMVGAVLLVFDFLVSRPAAIVVT